MKLFNTWWTISNSKTQYSSRNYLGNAAVDGDNKPAFLRAMASWINSWRNERISNFEQFSLTTQTASAFVRTLLCHAALIEDLLTEGYDFVLTARFQSDPLERRYGQYRQMSGGRFLVGLKDVTVSEKIIKIKSLLKEGIDIDENVKTPKEDGEKLELLISDIDILNCSTDTISLSDSSREVGVHIAGYVAKKLKKRMGKCCTSYLIEKSISVKNPDYSYIEILSRGGLTIPSMNLANYVCSAFAMLDFTAPTTLKSDIADRTAAEHVLFHQLQSFETFTCDTHKEKGQKLANRIITNIYFNNKRKQSTDTVMKDKVKSFKKRQREKWLKFCFIFYNSFFIIYLIILAIYNSYYHIL